MSAEFENIIERVARIIDPQAWKSYDRARQEGWDEATKAMTAKNVAPSLETARAAYAEVLAAIAEPTDDRIGMNNMARTGAAEMWQCAVKENTVGLPDAVRIWKAMLRAAPRE